MGLGHEWFIKLQVIPMCPGLRASRLDNHCLSFALRVYKFRVPQPAILCASHTPMLPPHTYPTIDLSNSFSFLKSQLKYAFIRLSEGGIT